ncbi:MAG: glycosyltransferase family 4 protein [Bryobacteraceae bacterium]
MAKPWPVLLMVRELGIGGCERDVTKIAIGLNRSHFEPHVGCFHPEGLRTAQLKAAGVPIVHFPVRSFKSRSALEGIARMRDYLSEHRIRIVHSYDVPMNLFGAPVARLFRAPIVITSQLAYRALFRPMSRHLLRITDQLSDRIVVNCEAMRRHMMEDEKVPSGRLYLCYNGVETEIFHPVNGEPKPALLKDAALVVGVVCALRPEKRVDLLLEAFARVRHLRRGLKLFVLGSGPLLSDLLAQAARLGMAEDCVFEPASSEVAPWMRAIDIFVLPSVSEAFSNALLEAMASGCCPIGSRVGGTPELIAHEERGFVFEPGNAEDLAAKLAVLIQDDDLRLRFAAASARFAREQLSVEIAVGRMEDLYTRLILEKCGP